jgi:hypothetical protein
VEGPEGEELRKAEETDKARSKGEDARAKRERVGEGSTGARVDPLTPALSPKGARGKKTAPGRGR